MTLHILYGVSYLSQQYNATLNRGSLSSNLPCGRFKAQAFLFTTRCPSALSFMKEYLAIRSGGIM